MNAHERRKMRRRWSRLTGLDLTLDEALWARRVARNYSHMNRVVAWCERTGNVSDAHAETWDSWQGEGCRPWDPVYQARMFVEVFMRVPPQHEHNDGLPF